MIESSATKSSSRSARTGLPRCWPEPREGVLDIGRVGEPDLTAAGSWPNGDLEPEWEAKRVGAGGRPQLVDRPDLPPGGDGDPGRLDEAPLREAVLGDDEGTMARPDRDNGLECLDDLGGHVLELVCHDVADVGESQGRADVVVRPDHHDVEPATAAAGQSGSWTRIAEAVAHRPGGRTPASGPAGRHRGSRSWPGAGSVADRSGKGEFEVTGRKCRRRRHVETVTPADLEATPSTWARRLRLGCRADDGRASWRLILT